MRNPIILNVFYNSNNSLFLNLFLPIFENAQPSDVYMLGMLG